MRAVEDHAYPAITGGAGIMPHIDSVRQPVHRRASWFPDATVGSPPAKL